MHMDMHNNSHCSAVVPLNPQAEQPQQSIGGAIIDDQGREIPITEQMIQQACCELEKAWCPATKKT